MDAITQRMLDALTQGYSRGLLTPDQRKKAEELAERGVIKLEREMPLTEGMVGGVEAAATMASGIPAEIGAGLAGMGTLAATGDPINAEENIDATRQAMTYEPRTDKGKESLQALNDSDVMQYISNLSEYAEKTAGDFGFEYGGPIGGAIGAALPTAVMEVIGTPAVAGSIMANAGRRTARKGDYLKAELDNMRGDVATPEGVEGIGKELAGGSMPDIQNLVDFDPEVLAAAQRQGLKDVPLSVATANPQMRDLAQGMASVSGSPAKSAYGKFLEDMALKADEIIQKGGGTTDKPGISQQHRVETNDAIGNLKKLEGEAYKSIEKAIDPRSKIDLPVLREFMDEQMELAGRYADLQPDLKKLYRLVYDKTPEGWVERTPTYNTFNTERKLLGRKAGMPGSPYATLESGARKRLYGKMKDQQLAIARDFDIEDLQTGVDQLTIKRGEMQDGMVNLLGNKLQKDLMAEMGTLTTGLARKGNIERFKRAVEDIPANLRSKVVVSSLNDILKGSGADQKGLGAAKFVGVMNELNRSPTAKAALFKYVPKRTQRAINDMHTLANAVYKANKENITTGKISQFFPENNGFLKKMMGLVGTGVKAKAGMSAGPAGSRAVDLAADSIGELFENSSDMARKANVFIASKEMNQLIRNAVADGMVQGQKATAKTERIEKLVQRTANYKRWADALPQDAKAKIGSVGLAAYLLAPEQEQEQ